MRSGWGDLLEAVRGAEVGALITGGRVAEGGCVLLLNPSPKQVALKGEELTVRQPTEQVADVLALRDGGEPRLVVALVEMKGGRIRVDDAVRQLQGLADCAVRLLARHGGRRQPACDVVPLLLHTGGMHTGDRQRLKTNGKVRVHGKELSVIPHKQPGAHAELDKMLPRTQ